MKSIVAAILLGALSATFAAAATPAAGTGRIYVTRKGSDVVPFPSPLAVDSTRVAGGVPQGACLYFDLPPGVHTIHAMSENSLSVTLAAGDAKYVEVLATERQIGGGYLDQITPMAVDKFADTSACTPGAMP